MEIDEQGETFETAVSADHKPLPAPAHPLRVLTLTPFFPSAENEVNGCFVKEPLDELVQLGVASIVFAAVPLHQGKRSVSDSAPASWIRFPQLPGNIGLSGAGYFLSAVALRRAVHLHRENPFHLIHAHSAMPCGHAAAILSRHLNIPFVVTVHGLDVFNAYQNRTTARWRRQRSIAVYEKAQRVICISDKVREILHEGMGNRVRPVVVHNGVDPNRFSPGAAQANPVGNELLAVGNLNPYKDQRLLLQAVARLAPSFPELRCQIIGEGPDGAHLQALSRELGIAQRVNFLGRRSRAEVAKAMRACSIFVLPSRTEGLGCVYLEAMACAKPVIACQGQGIEEIIEQGKNGWLVAPGSLDELTQTLSTLLRSPSLRAEVGLAARQLIVRRFTLSHQAHSLLRTYREVIE